MTTEAKPFPVSLSRVEAFDCQYHFHRHYILGEQVQDNDALRGGRFAHAVVEKYNSILLESKTDSDFDLFMQILNQEWASGYLRESRYEEMRDMLIGFAERHVLDPDATLGAEVQIALNWDLQETGWDANDAWLRSKLDLVQVFGKKAKITDYKTAFHAPSETELKKNLQGKIYAWALHILNPYLEEFQILYDYIRFGIKRSVEFTLDDIRPVEDRLRDFSQRVAAKIADPEAEWLATVCDRCYICSLECPLTDREVGALNTPEKAVEAGMQVQALERKVKRLKEDLKCYIKAREELIEIPTGTYGFNKTESMSVDVNQLVDYCLEKGVDVSLLLGFDKKKFEKLEEDEVKGEVREMATFKSGTRFGFKKKSEDLRGEGE